MTDKIKIKKPTTKDLFLEMAAKECLEQMPEGIDDWEKGYRMACEENANNIRKLKDRP